MKNLKMVLLMGWMVLAGASVSAQSCGANCKKDGKRLSATEMAEKRTARMTEALSLTAEQQEQVKQFNLEHARKMEARRAEMEAEKKELQKILTPEQFAKWEQMSQRGAHRGPGKKQACKQEAGHKKPCCGHGSGSRNSK